MISYLLVVEQHRTQIVIHALLKCQQENLYHEQNEIGRASCRERGEISVVAVSLKKKINAKKPADSGQGTETKDQEQRTSKRTRTNTTQKQKRRTKRKP